MTTNEQQEATSDTAPQVETPEVQPLRVWAEKAGHLPESFEGDKMRPVRNNRKAWIVRAVCAQLRLDLDSPIVETKYLEAAAAIVAVDAR